MKASLGQYCINVTDLDASVGFYTALGLDCTSRTEIPQAFEAIVENPAGGSKLQLARQKDHEGALDLGTAFWKLYVNTHDIGGHVRGGARRGGVGGLGPRAARPLARDGRLRAGPGRLPGRAGGAPPVAGGCAGRGLARPVLPQRDRHRGHDRLLRAAGAHLHQPHRHRRGAGGHRREPGRGRQAAARPAAGPGRAAAHGLDVEAVRDHRRLRGPAPAGRRRRPPLAGATDAPRPAGPSRSPSSAIPTATRSSSSSATTTDPPPPTEGPM